MLCEHPVNLLYCSSFPSLVFHLPLAHTLASHTQLFWFFLIFQPSFADCSSTVCAEAQCKTKAKADIILLVDGSWSIGRMNFKTIRNFISRTVSVFDIGPSRVQIGNLRPPPDPWSRPEQDQAQIFVSAGLAQYSGDPKTEWHLNAHPTKESLLNAVANLPYKGGNTRTGEGGAGDPPPPGLSDRRSVLLCPLPAHSGSCVPQEWP